MKKIPSVFIIFTACLTATAQTRELTKKSTYFIEKYAVLTADEQVKEGSYEKSDLVSKDILEKGIFHDNQRTGIWEFYNSGNTRYWQYDADKKEVVAINPDKKKDTCIIERQPGKWIETTVSRQPLLIGSLYAMCKPIIMGFRLPRNVQKQNPNGTFSYTILLIISSEGKVREVKPFQDYGNEVNKELLRVTQHIYETDWLPAVFLGKPVASIYNIPIIIKGFGIQR